MDLATGNNTSIGYIVSTGASSADRSQFQTIVTIDGPNEGNVTSACNGRQGAYFLSVPPPPDTVVESTSPDMVIYVLPTPGGTTDVPYETAPKMDYVWRSKRFVMPGRTTWAAAKVVHKCGGCVRLRLYADGCLAYDGVVRDSQPFRLPSQIVGTTLDIELVGSAEVDELHVASSMKELLSQ